MMPCDAFRITLTPPKENDTPKKSISHQRHHLSTTPLFTQSSPINNRSSSNNSSKISKQFSVLSSPNNPQFQRAKPRILHMFHELGIDALNYNITSQNIFEFLVNKVKPRIIDLQGKNKQLVHRINQQQMKANNSQTVNRQLQLIGKSYKNKGLELEQELKRKNQEIKQLNQQMEIKNIQINWLRRKLEQNSKQISQLIKAKDYQLQPKVSESNKQNNFIRSATKRGDNSKQKKFIMQASFSSLSKDTKQKDKDYALLKTKYDKSKQAYYRLVHESQNVERQLNKYIQKLEPELDRLQKENELLNINYQQSLMVMKELQDQHKKGEKDVLSTFKNKTLQDNKNE